MNLSIVGHKTGHDLSLEFYFVEERTASNIDVFGFVEKRPCWLGLVGFTTSCAVRCIACAQLLTVRFLLYGLCGVFLTGCLE